MKILRIEIKKNRDAVYENSVAIKIINYYKWVKNYAKKELKVKISISEESDKMNRN